MIEIINVSYAYEGRTALSDITVSISRGEAVALMGPNGSGKSTLLKLINGIVSPDSGTYKFDKEEITQKRLRNTKFSKLFHQKIGFVFQNSDTQLFCANVYDEIAFGPRQMGMGEREVEARVNDCLSLLNIESLKDRQPYHLSGGEKRKLAIACVLSMNPDVLVLDEPMNGLDPRTQRWLVEFLTELNKAGKTLITSTHNLELVQEISSRAVLFDEDHKIAADTNTKKLLENIDLLKKVNLIDEYYHRHEGNEHSHYHIHNYGHKP
ncbi:cobalt/nickel transport system ATP-binding protein [Ruminiclostridium sufflavum DSM 19573]|uniref:Cobalt/nickel transport system ATP-binding protein n=1 Tax=Ruminiclostridium sufflavum DSM 19573 TaxID=1121337 RepID=A0A318XHG0_9FIRM|nr:ABC transporter ATP-binding protein [Ruminiclostridium sufflavum]PYG84301.1 cobalt/nickel transport system ATP-binding protein [Ruminiclostridium sufflavum DSM 19573]